MLPQKNRGSARPRPSRGTLLLLLPLVLHISHWRSCSAVQGASSNSTVVKVSTETELRQALTTGKPILVVNSIFLNSSLPIITSSVIISGDFPTCKSLKGGYCRIDCKRSCRQFTVDQGGSLTLANIMIARGVAPLTEASGGAILIRNGGTVIAQTVIFRYNGAPGAVSGGGAVEVETGGNFFVTECLFLRNYAGFGGGVAAAKNANVVIKSSFFNRNTALTAGGAISLILNSSAILNANDYHGNTAAVGGAIHVDDSNASICKEWDRANNATVIGPQVYASTFAKLFGCQLSYNFVVLQNGASLAENCIYCQ